MTRTALTSTERIFLRLESPGYPIDVAAIFIIGPGPDGQLPFEQARARLARAAYTLPVFRRKLATAPLHIGDEHWVIAEHIDIDDHLHHVAVHEPGDLAALLRLVVEVTANPLDRHLPLWDAWYVDGVEGGRSALILRAHHALIDGVASVQMYGSIFDLAPAPVDPNALPTPREVNPEPGFLTRALAEIPDRIGGQVTAAAHILTTAARLAPDLVTRQLRGIGRPRLPSYLPSLTNHPPRTRFNRTVARPDKSLAAISLPWADIKAVRAAFPGVTAGDVLLALVTGSLRRYLIARDELPDGPLRTTCPVNVRPSDASAQEEIGKGGNAFTTMWVDLPVHLADPQERLHAVHANATSSKSDLKRAESAWGVLADVGELFLPPVVSAAMAFAGTGVASLVPPTLNLTVSTMPGPPSPMYMGGHEVEHIYARTIIHAPVHLFFHSITYNGKVEFGVTSVAELVPEPEELTNALRDELDALLAAAPTPTGPL